VLHYKDTQIKLKHIFETACHLCNNIRFALFLFIVFSVISSILFLVYGGAENESCLCGIYKYPFVIISVILPLAIYINWRIMRSININLKKPRKFFSDVVAYKYLQNTRIETAYLTATMVAIFFGMWILPFSDVFPLLLIIFVIFGVYPLTTLWRIRRGFFASNATEAEELIVFMLSKTHRDSAPPSSRAILDEEEILKEMVRERLLAGIPARVSL
jgi:hypothetical protein